VGNQRMRDQWTRAGLRLLPPLLILLVALMVAPLARASSSVTDALSQATSAIQLAQQIAGNAQQAAATTIAQAQDTAGKAMADAQSAAGAAIDQARATVPTVSAQNGAGSAPSASPSAAPSMRTGTGAPDTAVPHVALSVPSPQTEPEAVLPEAQPAATSAEASPYVGSASALGPKAGNLPSPEAQAALMDKSWRLASGLDHRNARPRTWPGDRTLATPATAERPGASPRVEAPTRPLWQAVIQPTMPTSAYGLPTASRHAPTAATRKPPHHPTAAVRPGPTANAPSLVVSGPVALSPAGSGAAGAGGGGGGAGPAMGLLAAAALSLLIALSSRRLSLDLPPWRSALAVSRLERPG
jgi:hypothetical protein